jgi:hypothetical protein
MCLKNGIRKIKNYALARIRPKPTILLADDHRLRRTREI